MLLDPRRDWAKFRDLPVDVVTANRHEDTQVRYRGTDKGRKQRRQPCERWRERRGAKAEEAAESSLAAKSTAPTRNGNRSRPLDLTAAP